MFSEPFACRTCTRHLSVTVAVLRMKPQKSKFESEQVWHGKDPSSSNAISTEQRPRFFCPSTVMVMSFRGTKNNKLPTYFLKQH